MYSRILMMIVCALTLSACTMQTYSWYRPGLTEVEWRRDSCKRDPTHKCGGFNTVATHSVVRTARFSQDGLLRPPRERRHT